MTLSIEKLLTSAEVDYLGRQGGSFEDALQIIADRGGPLSYTKRDVLNELGYELTEDGGVIPLAADDEVAEDSDQDDGDPADSFDADPGDPGEDSDQNDEEIET